jgi:AraC-like DNA-binding protein
LLNLRKKLFVVCVRGTVSVAHWPKGSVHDWESLRSELLFIYDRPVAPESHMRKGNREGDFSAWLVREGGAAVIADGERASAVPGQWLVCFGRQVEQSLEPGTHLLSLRVLQDWPDGSSLFPGKALHVIEARDHPQLEKLARPLVRLSGNLSLDTSAIDPRVEFLWKTQLDYLTYCRYRSHLSEWLAALASALVAEGGSMHVPGSNDPRLARMFQVIDAVSPGDAFPEREVCRAAGLSIGRLNRLCVQAYGFTAHAYWEKRRVQRARQALESPDVRIKEVASQLGFVQLSHFSAWFKRHAGASPRAYRQELER